MKQLVQIAALCILPGLAAAASVEPTFRLVSFDTSSLPTVFTILDARPEAAESQALAANDFQLLEDGKATAATTRTLKFRDTGAGLALVVAIDASQSMNGRPIAAIRKGLVQLISRKRESDRITVLTFADDVRWETRWNASTVAMRQAFENLTTRGNKTRLYDAVDQAMDEIAAQSRQDSDFPSRSGILVLSDGHDEGSRTSLNRLTGRLRASRVRLDAAGLARTPFWLRSLQALANAGFGGFRTASTPEQLTQMLGQGIDALLDMPAIEFKAESLSGDGRPHQLGVEYLPSHWRDQMTETLPQRPLFGKAPFWAAVGVLALLVIAAAIYFARRRGRRAAPQSAPVLASLAPRSQAPVRIETQVEPTANSQPVSLPPRVPTLVEAKAEAFTRSAPVSIAEPASPAPRIGTVLASQYSRSAGVTTLLAAAGPYAGQRFPISEKEFWIGFGSNNHLCLSADPAVSGNHACIRHEDRFVRLYDNGSLNNTMVNGHPISREVVLLQAGDRIRIGQSEFLVEA